MFLKTLPLFELSPYSLSLWCLFFAMGAQVFAFFFALRECQNRRARMAWIALTCAMFFLLRQRWAAFEFSLVTSVYDSFSAFCDMSASLFLVLAIIGFVRAGQGR